MPYSIKPNNGKFEVVTTGTDKVHGTFATRAAAEAQMRALYANANPDDENSESTPDNESGEKSLDFSYIKSIGFSLDPEIVAVKSVGADTIRAYSMLWGAPNLTDIETEYFTKKTDFWDKERGGIAPAALTWDHDQDTSLKASPVIGQVTDFGDDEVGRWFVAKLDGSHRYRKAVDALIEAGKLGASSDTAPQYSQRVKTGKSTWLKRWPWFATALTNMPAEPRMLTDGSPEYLKSIGVCLPDTSVAMWKWQTDRMKILKAKMNLGD